MAQVGYPPLAYMDPQLLRGQGGRWSDIWALGATVHQVVAGLSAVSGHRRGAGGPGPLQLLMAPAPGLGELPAAVAELVASCLAVDPAIRPPTAGDVAARLTKRRPNGDARARPVMTRQAVNPCRGGRSTSARQT